MRKVIKNKIRLLNKSGFLASSLLNNEAMENTYLNRFIKRTYEEYKPEQDISRIVNFYSKRYKVNEYITKNYGFDEDIFYEFFSNIEIDKLDIRDLKLENVKFNSLFSNSIIKELIISKKNYVKQKLDYWNQNLKNRAKINKITIILRERKIEYINDSDDNFDLLIKIILNNIDQIKDNDSSETIKSKFNKIKDKINEERKNFIAKVNEKKEFNKDENSYYYDLDGTTICKFNINISETLINIDCVRTLGSYSGCGLLKSLISEIYKKNGILPIVLKEPTTIGKEVYKKLGFVECKNIELESAINLTKNITNDFRFLHWMLDEKNNKILKKYDMVLLPIKENIKKKFFKDDDERFKRIENTFEKKFLYDYKKFMKNTTNYYYDLHDTTIFIFNINISETLINIDRLRTLGSYSGCGLLKSLISEIYKENGILPIVLKEPKTIGEDVYKELGFVKCKNIELESAINLTKNITNDCRILHWMLDEKNNEILKNYDMVLLPIKENIKNIFFKDDDERFKRIENTIEKFLDYYKNNDILKEHYIEYIKKNKFSGKYEIFQYIKNIILKKNIDTIKDAEEYYKSIVKEEFKRIISKKEYDKKEIKNKLIEKEFAKKIIKSIKTSKVFHFYKKYFFKSFKNESKSLQNKFNNTKNNILNIFDDTEKNYFAACDLFIEYIKQGHKRIAFNESNVNINYMTIKKIKETSNDLFFQNKDLLNFHNRIGIHNIQELTNKKNLFSLKYFEFINNLFKKYPDYQNSNNVTDFNAYIENLKKDLANNKKDKNEIKELLSKLVDIRTNFYNECTNFLSENIPDYLYSFLFYYINMDFFNISNELSSIIKYINTNFVESDNYESDNYESDNYEPDNYEPDSDESGD